MFSGSICCCELFALIEISAWVIFSALKVRICEKNIIPRISVTTAWNSNMILPHLIILYRREVYKVLEEISFLSWVMNLSMVVVVISFESRFRIAILFCCFSFSPTVRR